MRQAGSSSAYETDFAPMGAASDCGTSASAVPVRRSPPEQAQLASMPRRRPSLRRPVTVVDGTLNSTTGGPATGENEKYHPASNTTPRGPTTKFSAARWSLAGFAIGIVFWHFVGFWDFLRDTVLYENPQAAELKRSLFTTAIAEPDQSAQIGATQVIAHIKIAAPVQIDNDCVALIIQPDGSTASASCAQTMDGMRDSNSIAKGDFDSTAGNIAMAEPALPSWNSKLVKSTTKLVVKLR